MELLLTVTLSDRLFALLEEKLPNLNRRFEQATTKDLDTRTRRASSISVEVNACALPTPANAEPSIAETAPAPCHEVEAEAAPEPAVHEVEKELTEVDVRAAMDRTRRRIEGENYKEDTNSEGYKKWHRALTGRFKQIATILGADKPSALPDHASRAAFIAEVDELIIKNGELTVEVPF